MSAAASTVKLFALIVKSVPSPSIFSPSSPNVKPTLAGILISAAASKLISASASSVISPEPKETISAITGVVKVLFVNVSVETKRYKS